jgi:Lar family restriction alleviation protein
MTEQLKPCPHCGSTDLSGPHFDEYVGDSVAPHWWIDCNICPCNMEVWGRDKKHILEAWNMRSNVAETPNKEE